MTYNNNKYDLSLVFTGKSKRLSSKPDKEQLKIIYKLTDFYPVFNEKNDLKVRAYIVKNNILPQDLLCKSCGKNYVKFNSPSKGFVTYCSPQCANTSPEFVEKSKKTCLERYGHEYNFGSSSSKLKKALTLEKKFNTKNSDKLSDKQFIIDNFIVNGFFNAKDFMFYFNCSSRTAYRKVKELGISYKKRVGSSQSEYEIIKFLENYESNIIHNDTNLIKKELDVLIPNKFAIEYDGMMYHSYGKSKYAMFNNFEKEYRKRHMIKTDLCEEHGVQLFHIFENEWIDPIKQKIWKSVLLSKLGKTTRIFARKCLIKEVSNKDSFAFLNNNHLQGGINSNINYGLYYNDELVSLMTFGKSRMSKKYQYELLRFCSKLNTTVVGGASKLLKHFEREIKPKSLVSYANRRWSTGNLYDKIGFTFSHNSLPNYFYFKNNSNILESRNKYQKHKLSKILPIFDNTLTETMNMYNNDYRKIYDAGNKIYIKEYK